MKEGWTYKKLGECIDNLRTGLNPRTHFKLNTPDATGYYITVRELCGFSFKVNSKTDRVNDKALKRINERSNLQIGDVLYSGTGTIGKTALVTELPTWWNIKEGVYAITPKHDILDSLFLIYLTQSEFFINSINSKTSGTTVKSIPMKEFVGINIPVPPLSEQQSIVAQLDEAFAEIDIIKAEAEKQLSDAKALFQKALSQAMTPKEGWEKKTLGDITISMADGPFGSNLKKEHYTTKKEVRIIQLSNIGEEGWREDNTKYTTFEHLKTIQRSEVKPNDIVIAKMMPAGRAILCPNKESAYVLSSDAVRATLKDDLNNRFILFSINSEHFRKQVYANVSGSGRVRTSLTKLKVCSLWLPPLSEQQRIVDELDELSENVREIEALNNKLKAECDAMKQALLRQVFE